MSRSPARALALTLMAATALSACGLKTEVKDQLAAGGTTGGVGTGVGTTGGIDTTTTGGAPVTGTTGTVPGATTGSTVSSTTGTLASGSSGTTGGTATSGTTGSGTTGTTGTSVAPPVQGQGTTTGIDFKNKTVSIALHGPLTGAGVPQESFRSGTPKYWAKYKLANGFSVKAVAIDDKYNAADASRACNAAADTNFLIVGGAGTDQISACAQSPKLRRLKVPYLSSGVTAVGLGDISTYHATSLTYAEQAPLVVAAAKKAPTGDEFTGKKWAIVITSTPNFKDAREAFVAELQKNGAQGSAGAFNPSKDVFLTDKAPSNCSSLGTSLRAGGYQSIYFLGQPSFFAQCVGTVGTAPINPYYTGPGPSFGISSVISLACKASAGAYKGVYLHPSPSVAEYAKQLAPGQSFTDDIEFGIWGAMEQLKRVFDSVQGPLSRESFNAALDGHVFPGFPKGVLHTADYTADRFGGTAAFANAAGNCASSAPVSKTVAIYQK